MCVPHNRHISQNNKNIESFHIIFCMDLCSIFILLYHTLKVNDLSNDVNLDKILKLDLGY
jgi:hypothetical protein